MNRFVIADPRNCIGCFACMAACIESHRQVGLQAYPRLYVTRTSAGMIPLQCRHCEEPQCAAVCPVQAIRQVEDHIHLNESLCIGCKLCALACPFGAIIAGGTPVHVQEFNAGQYAFLNTPYQADPMVLRQLSLQEQLSLAVWTKGKKTVAVKCDLCTFRSEGPACVQACPHGALRLVEGERLDNPDLALQMKEPGPFNSRERQAV
jgi:hydrogenase-4 component A